MQRADNEQWKSTEVARLLSLVEMERRYYQDIFAVLPVPVAMIDAALNITAVNREFRRCFDLENSDLGRVRLPDLLPDPGLESAIEDVQLTRAPSSTCDVTLRREPASKSLRVSIHPVPGWHNDSDRELLLTFQEAAPQPPPAPEPTPAADSESSKLEALERLSGRVAHVANNLLMIIGGYASDLIESFPANDSRRDDLNEILTASTRLARLTKDLSEFTRPQKYEPGDFDARPRLAAAASRHHLLYRTAEDGPLPVRGSGPLLDRVLHEAARFLKPHAGELPLTLDTRSTAAGTVEFVVSLNGVTLPETAEAQIFEPFSGPKEGTDPPLGLAGLIRPVRHVGGSMRVEAHSALVLTLHQGQAPVAAPPAATVLVVEDEPGIRSLITKTLEKQRYRVIHAGSAVDAMAAARTASPLPQLLVTDLTMPGIGGRQLAAQLRADIPNLRVLYISGYTADPEMKESLSSGTLPRGTGFLAKPFATQQLLDAVKGLLGTP